METLKGSQKRYLKGLANNLKPLVFIGKSGLSEQVFSAINEVLENNELFKVRFLEHKEEKKQQCEEIAKRNRCFIVGLVGHVGLFFRQHKNPEKRKIKLPK